jgi:hypothetical protein
VFEGGILQLGLTAGPHMLNATREAIATRVRAIQTNPL